MGIDPDVTVDLPATVTPDQDPVLDRALEVIGALRRPAAGPPRRERPARPAHRAALALRRRFGYGFAERKEVMCSDRQYA